MLKFKFLTGDINWQTYGGKFISKKLNNSEFDYWLILEVINLKEACGEDEPLTYNVSVSAIAPSQLSDTIIDNAFSSCGWDNDLNKDDFIKKYDITGLVEVISDYTGGAVIYQESGNNLSKLLKEAHKEAYIMGDFMFDFAMDKVQNQIGSSGWDILQGNILAGLGIYDNEVKNDEE
jgi:hypothetical protein